MTTETLRDEAAEIQDDLVALRRTLHQWPELGNHLPVTREQVLGALEGLPLDVTLHETTSGIAGMLTGGPRPYGPKDRQAFAAALDRVLARALRQR